MRQSRRICRHVAWRSLFAGIEFVLQSKRTCPPRIAVSITVRIGIGAGDTVLDARPIRLFGDAHGSSAMTVARVEVDWSE